MTNQDPAQPTDIVPWRKRLLKRIRDQLQQSRIKAKLESAGGAVRRLWEGYVVPYKGPIAFGIVFAAAVWLYHAPLLEYYESLDGGEQASFVAVIIGAYVAWRRVKAADSLAKAANKNADAANENVKTLIQGQITERFTRAIEQLGDDKQMTVRLGGIYALERIMKDSEEDHWTIVEVLAAFVRERAPWEEPEKPGEGAEGKSQKNDKSATGEDVKLEQDVQAALTVLGRRPQDREEFGEVDLRGTDLQGADLVKAYLPKAHLVGAHLERAHLVGAHLERAHLVGAHLERAHLVGAHLERANLVGAHLEHANLEHARLSGANLLSAHLNDANLISTNLKRANLGSAHLNGANLIGAHLEDAILVSAHLEDATLWAPHFGSAQHLTVFHILTVKTLYGATLNPDLEQAVREQKPELFEKPRKHNQSI